MKMRKMPFKKIWEQELSAEFGAETARDYLHRIEAGYRELCSNQHQIKHPMLKKHLYGNLFPQIAAYQFFLATGSLADTALARTQRFHYLTLKAERDRYTVLSHISCIFPIIRILVVLIVKIVHPPVGWRLEWVENSKSRIDLKVHSCFYHKFLTEYGIPELISIYCKGDDYVYAEVESPYVGWGRKNSIAIGSEYCDVIYYNKKVQGGK
jgi:hypothetical protein